MKIFLAIALVVIIEITLCNAQENASKQGWKFGGALPAIAYNSDEGFKYGALGYVYDYGKDYYPQYKKSIYVEWSRTTKGSGINNLIYDDKKFLNTNLRLTADINYLTEKMLDFYGFNGYEANFEADISDPDSPLYISRAYYRIERKLWRVLTCLRGKTKFENLNWYAGLIYMHHRIAAPDSEKLNKGKSGKDIIPTPTEQNNLYLKYIKDGIITDNEKNGGSVTQILAGLIYDTRDNEAFATHGIWAESFFSGSPKFLGNGGGYTAINSTLHQYFGICEGTLVFTYRVSFFSKLSGEMPFYMLPFFYNSQCVYNGLGGNRTLRGTLRNRVVGLSNAFLNAELRWKFIETKIGGQDLYFAFSGFFDSGRVLKSFRYSQLLQAGYVNGQEKWHSNAGIGLHVAYNNNFVITIDYGRCFDKQDGQSGLYVSVGWLW